MIWNVYLKHRNSLWLQLPIPKHSPLEKWFEELLTIYKDSVVWCRSFWRRLLRGEAARCYPLSEPKRQIHRFHCRFDSHPSLHVFHNRVSRSVSRQIVIISSTWWLTLITIFLLFVSLVCVQLVDFPFLVLSTLDKASTDNNARSDHFYRNLCWTRQV